MDLWNGTTKVSLLTFHKKDKEEDQNFTILTKDFLNQRIQEKIKLTDQNFEELGLEFDNSIFRDKDFIEKIFSQEENYPDEYIVTDFYEEVRSILDGKTRYSNYWNKIWGAIIGFLVFGILWFLV